MKSIPFDQNGFVVVRDFIAKDIALFLSDYLHVMAEINKNIGANLGDSQIPDANGVFHQDPALESLYLKQTEKMEGITGLSLSPTYIYARIYKNGNELTPHKDRPSCEISATIKLNESDDFCWPIAIEDNYIELGVGDAVIYKGCDVLHWRDKCEASDDYFLSQMFMHFVDKNGPYSDFKFDKNQNREIVLSKFI